MAAGLRIANIDLNKPQGFWNYAIWTDKTQAEMFVHKTQQHIWCISAQTPQNICKAWQKKGNDLGLFCSQWVNHRLLCILNWVMQKVSDPKHSSKPSTEWLKKRSMVLQWPSQSPHLKSMQKQVMEETQKSTPSRPCWQTNESQCVLSFRTLRGVQKLFFKPECTCWSKVFNQIWTPLFSQLKDLNEIDCIKSSPL